MSDAGAAIRVESLHKAFEEGRIQALRGVDLEIRPGEFTAIMGPSGCGKSTLLHLIGGLDVPDSGRVVVGGRDLSVGDLTEYRSTTVGFVFQLHNLIPVLTALENVQVPMMGPGGPPREERRARAEELIEEVGLVDRAHARPPELSGGERQRVAVARALANRPRLLLADEPTGSLDQESGSRILTLLQSVREAHGTSLILVSHEAAVAGRAERVLRMLDGRLE
jgi:putative ABC transport system ATP-binding protein